MELQPDKKKASVGLEWADTASIAFGSIVLSHLARNEDLATPPAGSRWVHLDIL